jgi:PPE-repeat protein
MSVTEANFVLGPAQLYVAVFGSTEPTDSTSSYSGAWVNVGATDGGVKVEIDETITDLTADQVLLSVGGRVTGQTITVTVNLAEITLANIVASMASNATITAGSGQSTLDPVTTTSATQPAYVALGIDGWAPRGTSTGSLNVRRMIVRKCLPDTKDSFTFDKKTQQALAVTFKAYYVSSSIAPWHFIDGQTA